MRHYSIIFNTTTGRRRSIRVNNPNTDLPLPEISAAVDQILENDVFDPLAGGLKNLNRMELSVLERTVIFE